jgi:hypothetical protein
MYAIKSVPVEDKGREKDVMEIEPKVKRERFITSTLSVSFVSRLCDREAVLPRSSL